VPQASSTRWHWTARPLASQGDPGTACGDAGVLSALVDDEHLCRRCGNCGYGWCEACVPPGGQAAPARADPDEADPDGVPGLVLAVLLSLAAGLACAVAGSWAGRELGGAALVAAWLVAAIAAAALAAAVYAAAARKGARR
jgi:hypothetical protein